MEVIRFENISKTFGRINANQHISFSVNKGEVLSILGENGSGKTTLLNILMGIYQQDEGKLYINEKETIIKSPRDALKHGIGMVHQHFKLVQVFSAVENIVLGLTKQDYQSFAQNLIDERDKLLKKALTDNSPDLQQAIKKLNKEIKKETSYNLKTSARRIKEMCDRYGFVIDPNKRVFEMSVSEKQTLEIVKALYRGVDTLILDEPTAVLTPQEISHLFTVIKNMKKDGKTIIIITHKLNEVMEISDRIAILRKGQYISTVNKLDTNPSELADLMVGRKVNLNILRDVVPNKSVRLEVKDLAVVNKTNKEVVSNVTFDLYGGEILGVAGIAGNGQKELLESIAGLNKQSNGTIIFRNPKKEQPVTFFHKNIKQIRELASLKKFHYKHGSIVDLTHKTNKEIIDLVNKEEIIFFEDEIIDLKNKKPIEIRDLGIKLSFVPEDRLGMGLVGNMNLIENMMLRSYRKGKGVFLHQEKPKELAKEIVEKLEVITPNLNTKVAKLSGGNIQKLLVGREISSRPKVLMVAYPVRGLDINSSFMIYNLLNEQKKKGTAIIFVGEDLDVLMDISDRIMVLSGGTINGIVDPKVTSKEEIGLLMAGARKED